MRELHQVNELPHLFLLWILTLFASNVTVFGQTSPLNNLPIDTATARQYTKICRNFLNKGQYQKAQATLDTLLAVASTAYAKNDSLKSLTYMLAGRVYFKQSSYNKAINFYKKAEEIYVQDSVKYLKQIGRCIGDIGAASLQKGEFDKANSLFIQSAEIKRKTVGENSVSLAYTYYNIGAGFAQQANYQSALDFFYKSVGIIRKAKGEQHPDVAFVYNAIGQVFMRQGDWNQANEYFNKGLAIREHTKTTEHPAAARDFDRIGIVHQKNGDLKAAQASYERAFDIRQKTLDPNHSAFNESYLNLATIHLLTNNLEEAENLMKKGLANKEKNLDANHPSFSDTYFQLARIAHKQNNLDQALAYYQTALVKLVPEFESLTIADNPKVTSSFRNKTKLSDLLFRKGITLFKQYSQQSDQPDLLTQAYETLTLSNEVGDMVRTDFSSDFSKKAWLAESFVIYEKLLEVGTVLANQPNPTVSYEDLFALMEKSKSILLLENLQDETAKEFSGVPKSALNQENQLKKQIAFFDNQLIQRKEKGVPPTDNRLMELEEKVFQLRQGYQNLVAQLEENHPKYFQLKHDKQLVGIADIQSHLPTESTAFLQYTMTPKNLYVMAITQKGIFQHQQAVDSTFYTQLAAVKKFLNTNPIVQSNTEQVTEREQFTKNAHTLYQQLLAPILTKIGTVKELIIIPDGDLNYLPFESLLTALPTPNNTAFDQLDYLLHQYAVHYEYSATLWWQNVRQKRATSQLFAGFAPEYQGDNLLASRAPTALGLVNQSVTFASLKYNQSEVNQLASDVGGQSVLGNSATESAFKKQAKNYGVLHLAMHAYVNDKNPNYSHLVFAEEKDSTEDRYLYAYELYNMQLNADMAVLSACETGDGQLQQGEGVMSLSRAFKYAGVPNIVMSFWKADDFYTKNIMTHFYQFLKKGDGKHKALQQAKKEQIIAAKDNKEAAHPYYWANFVLVGDSQPVQFANFQWWGWLACGVLLIFLTYFGFVRKV